MKSHATIPPKCASCGQAIPDGATKCNTCSAIDSVELACGDQKALTKEDCAWLIWALGFVSGAYAERDKENTQDNRARYVEDRCLQLAIKIQNL